MKSNACFKITVVRMLILKIILHFLRVKILWKNKLVSNKLIGNMWKEKKCVAQGTSFSNPQDPPSPKIFDGGINRDTSTTL